ncbi:uncharacterized protein SOCE26_013440 [Sorangium cellulosum]|uniref:Uncharacterized protein n=1 Tax=Sorangium cellulosum TaxID=56 RepID=A0A2L0EKX9_SORCE|nr:uncharacterized protein SOCE26_013440 [Sorangium cellulosum]
MVSVFARKATRARRVAAGRAFQRPLLPVVRHATPRHLLGDPSACPGLLSVNSPDLCCGSYAAHAKTFTMCTANLARLSTSSLVAMLAILLCGSRAHGQSVDKCNAVLAEHIVSNFEASMTDGATSEVAHWAMCQLTNTELLDEASRQICGSSTSNASKSGNFTFVVEDAFNLGANNGRSRTAAQKYCDSNANFKLDTWKSEQCGTSDSSTQKLTRAQKFARYAVNTGAIQSWQSCVQTLSNVPQLICTAQPDHAIFTVHLSWRGYDVGALQQLEADVFNGITNKFNSALASGTHLLMFTRQDRRTASKFVLSGKAEKTGTSFACELSIPPVCDNARYVKMRSPGCDIESIVEKADPACGVELYKKAASSVCGVEQYALRRSPACGVEDHKRNSGSACGPCELYRQGHTSACGKEWNGARKRCRHPKNGCERWPSCRKPEFGIERYKECRHPTHGVESNRACRHPNHGVEKYSTCALPAFGVIYAECEIPSNGIAECLDEPGGEKPSSNHYSSHYAPPPASPAPPPPTSLPPPLAPLHSGGGACACEVAAGTNRDNSVHWVTWVIGAAMLVIRRPRGAGYGLRTPRL